MPHLDYKAHAAQLQSFLTDTANHAGQLSHCQQRASKLDAATLAQTWILGLLQHPEATLDQLTRTSQQLGVAITRQGLDARVTPRLVMDFALLFAASLRTLRHPSRLPLAVLAPFSAVRLIDSTQIQLPAALASLFAGSSHGTASLKLQLCLDYLSGQLEALDWTAGREPDQRSTLPLEGAQAGSLLLFDLGYFDQTTLATIDRQGAYFVCRLHSQVALYHEADTRFDLEAACAAQTAEVVEYPVLLGAKAPARTRDCPPGSPCRRRPAPPSGQAARP